MYTYGVKNKTIIRTIKRKIKISLIHFNSWVLAYITRYISVKLPIQLCELSMALRKLLAKYSVLF